MCFLLVCQFYIFISNQNNFVFIKLDLVENDPVLQDIYNISVHVPLLYIAGNVLFCNFNKSYVPLSLLNNV